MVFMPAKHLSVDENREASSFELSKFMECIHINRGHLSVAEASLLHILLLRGWRKGVLMVPQSILALQTGLSIRSISTILKRFEEEVTIDRKIQKNRPSIITLSDKGVLMRATWLYQDDERRRRLIEAWCTNQRKKRSGGRDGASGATSEEVSACGLQSSVVDM